MRYLGILCLLTTMFATNIEFAHGQIEKLRGVCFSPIRDNESPARQITSLPSTVEADVEFASKIAGAMRTYTLSGSSYLIPELNREGIEYLYFAMTDEKWKEGDEGGPGAHWGLLKSDGTMKESFRGMFSEEINKGMERPARQLTFEN